MIINDIRNRQKAAKIKNGLQYFVPRKKQDLPSAMSYKRPGAIDATVLSVLFVYVNIFVYINTE